MQLAKLSSRVASRRHALYFLQHGFSTNTLPPTHTSKRPLDKPHNKPHETFEETTHFGYKHVPLRQKQTLVSSVFDSVAENYDMMNDIMSLRIHRLWKSRFVDAMKPTGDMRILDSAGGTGDIASRIVGVVDNAGGWTNDDAGVTVCDINDNMLSVGRDRMSELSNVQNKSALRVDFVNGDAQNLPFHDETFDLYTISFGMRNVPRPMLALREAWRVLKPGGRFMMLEFGQVQVPVIKQIYDAWSFNVIPNFGRFVARDEAAYRYLVESIRQFPPPAQFLHMMRQSHFTACSATNYSFGIAVCYSAFKLPLVETKFQ